MPSFVSHLESALDGTVLPADRLQTLHKDRPLWVHYDLDRVRAAFSKQSLATRPSICRRRALPAWDCAWRGMDSGLPTSLPAI